MSRCSTATNTVRSTANSKPRSATRSAITARQPLSDHKRSNKRGGPMRWQARPTLSPRSSADNTKLTGNFHGSFDLDRNYLENSDSALASSAYLPSPSR